jgi:hypothetical protein
MSNPNSELSKVIKDANVDKLLSATSIVTAFLEIQKMMKQINSLCVPDLNYIKTNPTISFIGCLNTARIKNEVLANIIKDVDKCSTELTYLRIDDINKQILLLKN